MIKMVNFMLCVYYHNFKNKGFPGGSVVGTVPYQGRGARVPILVGELRVHTLQGAAKNNLEKIFFLIF